jgi:hypothetical protein
MRYFSERPISQNAIYDYYKSVWCLIIKRIEICNQFLLKLVLYK